MTMWVSVFPIDRSHLFDAVSKPKFFWGLDFLLSKWKELQISKIQNSLNPFQFIFSFCHHTGKLNALSLLRRYYFIRNLGIYGRKKVELVGEHRISHFIAHVSVQHFPYSLSTSLFSFLLGIEHHESMGRMSLIFLGVLAPRTGMKRTFKKQLLNK